MIKLVRAMCKTVDITKFKTATTALKLLTSLNVLNHFKALVTSIPQLTTNITETASVKQTI